MGDVAGITTREREVEWDATGVTDHVNFRRQPAPASSKCVVRWFVSPPFLRFFTESRERQKQERRFDGWYSCEQTHLQTGVFVHDINTFLPFWEGFSVTAIRPDGNDLLIDLIPQPTRFPTCSGCHQPSTAIYEYRQRSIRDLPILGRAVRLNVELRRVGCSACGKRMESVRWLDRYSRMTRRLSEAVIQACQRLPTLHVAELFGLHWDSVRLLERRALQAALEKLPRAQPRRLVMDEFALFKGHRYASVLLDADTRRVLWIGEGRSRAAVRPFFEELGPEGCARTEAVAMDMNTAFDLEVRQHCPRARVVYDLFHVVAKYGRD